MSARPRRIGLLGGSFNPPHLAHLALARLALQALGLHELRWLVAGAPWQKPAGHLVAAEHRLAMVGLMIAAEPAMAADARETQRAGPTYTLDTVRELRLEAPQAKFSFILGADQWARLPTWHGFAELVPLLHWAVTARQGQAVHTPPELQALQPRHTVLALPAMDISATAVRQRCAQGQDVSALVGPQVAGYISRHHLYASPDGHS